MDRSESAPTRREVLKQAAGAAGAAAASSLLLPIAMGASPSAADVQIAEPRLIPVDKGLTAEAIGRLWQRGEQRTYRATERQTIGMPCGGVGAGQLYVLGDGRLGHFRIDGRHSFTGYGRENYRTYTPERPGEQGFEVFWEESSDGRGRERPREGAGRYAGLATLDDGGFDAIEFVGEYPVVRIRYRRADAGKAPPIEVDLEVFSPFVPLDARSSAWPATVMRFVVKNTSDASLKVGLSGWLENMVMVGADRPVGFKRRNRIERTGETLTSAVMDVVEYRPPQPDEPRRRVLFDFESGTYEGWTVAGKAFGDKPPTGTLPTQQRVSGFEGEHLVNSFEGGDKPRGRMLSRPFEIDLPYLTFRVGGGAHAGKTCMNLLIDEKVVRTRTGKNDERLVYSAWNVEEFAGREARLEIVDDHSGGWGHVNVDEIALANTLPDDFREFDESGLGFGSMALSLVGGGRATAELGVYEAFPAFPGSSKPSAQGESAGVARPVGHVTAVLELSPGESRDVTFIVSWHFPNLHTKHGVMYSNWYVDALDVARRLAADLDRLRAETLLFCDTYYRKTTLPWWLTTRLMMPNSTLATGTCQWWRNGRFWGWEGVGCCSGTCTHVWNYAQGHAWLFPELARSTRSMQDLGEGFDSATGLVGFRSNRAFAADGQAGTILKCYREHLTSPDGSFLESHWPRIKMALEYLIGRDGNADGIIENSQHNTFDINFFGPNTFVGSLYLAALRAGERMADLMGESQSAQRYRRIAETGGKWTSKNLFNGEFFRQRVPNDAKHDWQYGPGCLSDQVFGQNWAHSLDLGYVYPAEQVRSALASVYKYNWANDIGPPSEVHKPERWFARAGEGGLFTCTWPRGGRPDKPVRYRNEVWTGIEYQAAAGMVWEGLVDQALLMIRAIDDRYDGLRHNPYNEVECGDHYARAMASWGVLLALSGFSYDGPKKRIGFAPRVQRDDFACFFTSATGWGTIAQRRADNRQENSIEPAWGSVDVREFATELPQARGDARVEAFLVDAEGSGVGRKPLPATVVGAERRTVRFESTVRLAAGQRLEVRLTWS